MRSEVTSAQIMRPTAPYSSGIVSGGFAFLAGQGPFDVDGHRVGATFAEQTRRTFANLEAVAQAAGSSLKHAVRIGVYLKDLADFDEMNEISREFLGDPFPARTTIRVGLSGFDIEVDAIVAIPDAAE